MSEQKVDRITKSPHQGFPATSTSPSSRAVLTDYTNRNILQFKPDKTAVKQNELRNDEWKGVINIKDLVELRPTHSLPRPGPSPGIDKDLRPSQTSADDNFYILGLLSGDSDATLKSSFEGYLCKERSAVETEIPARKLPWRDDVGFDEKENAYRRQGNDRETNKTFIRDSDLKVPLQHSYSQPKNHRVLPVNALGTEKLTTKDSQNSSKGRSYTLREQRTKRIPISNLVTSLRTKPFQTPTDSACLSKTDFKISRNSINTDSDTLQRYSYSYFRAKNRTDGCKLGSIHVNATNRRRENDPEIKHALLYANSPGRRCGINSPSNCKILRSKNSHRFSESFTKGSLLKHQHTHNIVNCDRVRVSYNRNKTKVITSECQGKVYAGGMKNVNLTHSLDMNGELVKTGITEKIESRKFGASQKTRGTIKNRTDGVSAVLNSNPRKHRVKYGKLQSASTVSTTEKGSRIDNQHKRLPELPTSPEKKPDGILNGGDKTSPTQEGQFTEGDEQGQTRQSDRKDSVQCPTARPRLHNQGHQNQNRRSCSEHRVGSYIYWGSDAGVGPNIGDYDYHNDGKLSRYVDGIINSVGLSTQIYENSLGPDGESKLKIAGETCKDNDIHGPQDHASNDLDTSPSRNPDINNKKDQILLCQADNKIKGAQHFKENTTPTANETLCHGDLKGQPSGNYTTKRDQGVLIREQDNTLDGLPVISEIRGGNGPKEPPRFRCGMNKQLAQTGKTPKSCKVGSEGPSVGEHAPTKVFTDNSQSKGTVNTKTISDRNKTQRRKSVVLIQEENIKELYSNTKENKSERRSTGNFTCSNAQNRSKNLTHVTLHAKTSISKGAQAIDQKKRELSRTPTDLAKNTATAGKSKLSSTCKRPGCKHSTLIGYKPGQKCSPVAKHSQSYQETENLLTFSEPANECGTVVRNTASPKESISTISITENASKEPERVGDNTCCDTITDAHCNAEEDSRRQQESSADNINSDACLLQNEKYRSDLSEINVRINNGEPISVPAVDINGFTLQSSPNEEIKQSGSTLVEVTNEFEGAENECNGSLYPNDNRQGIMDPQTNNEMEIGCDSVSNDNNKGHGRGADQTSNVPDHSQLHASKDGYKTGTLECVSKQSNVQLRQASISTIDSKNKHLDAEQRQHSTLKDESLDNEAKGRETKDEKAINLKPGKANTTSLIIKDTGIQLGDGEGSMTDLSISSCRQKTNNQSANSKLVNRQLKASVSGVPVPKHSSRLPKTQTFSGQSKSHSKPTRVLSPTGNCVPSTSKQSETSNSSRSSMERSMEMSPEESTKSDDSQTPKSPKLRIHQTKTSRQRAKNATKNSPTETKHLVNTESNIVENKKKSPTVTKRDIIKPKETLRASSQSPRLADTRKIKTTSVSPVVSKRTTTRTQPSPNMSRKSPLSLHLPLQKSAKGVCSRSSSASRSSKESTPDNSLHLCSKSPSTSRATLQQKSQKDAGKSPVVTSTTSDKTHSSLPIKSSARTGGVTVRNTKTQDKTGQNRTLTCSVGVKTQRNAIPIRKNQISSVIKSPKESPNLTRKNDKTQSGLANKSNESKQNSSVQHSISTKESCENDKTKHESGQQMKYVLKSKKNHSLVESGGHINKQESFSLPRKSEISIDKTKNTTSVKRITTVESPSTKRKIESKPSKEHDKNKGIPKAKSCQTTTVKSMLPKSHKVQTKIDSKHDKTEKEVSSLSCSKEKSISSIDILGIDCKSLKSEKTTANAKPAVTVKNAFIKSPTLKTRTLSQTSIPKTMLPKSSRPAQKASTLTKSKADARSSIPTPRSSTPIQVTSAKIPKKTLSKSKPSLKQNINPDIGTLIKNDNMQTGGNTLSKTDKNKSIKREKINKEANATTSYLSSKSQSIKEYEGTSDENRCTKPMEEDGYNEFKSAISSNTDSQEYTTVSSQISSDVIEEKKKCEETVSINSSSTVESSFGQKINEANKTRNVSTSSEEYWSASDDENLDNVSSCNNTHSYKNQCFEQSQSSNQDVHLGIILENTQEKSSEAKLKDGEKNEFKRDRGNSLSVLGPHGYIIGTEPTTVHSNQEMAMRLPVMKQLRESQQCNYHVQVADDRETNLKINSKSDDNGKAVAKTILPPKNDVHKDATDLIPLNITHQLVREEDRAVLNVNSERLCKKDKNQYVPTDIETKLSGLTNIRDYFDERNDNSKFRINEGSKGASQPVQRKKSFGNHHSKNTMDNLSNLSYENCVSTQQAAQDGLYSSSNETSDQKFSSEISTLQRALNSTDEVKNSDTFRKVAEKCVESAQDSEPHVEKFSLKFDANKNADKCTPGEKLSTSEPNPTNEKTLNLSNGTGTGLDSPSSDTSNQEEFESFDSDSGDSMMENGNCDIKLPMDDQTTTAYTTSNMEIQKGPTRRITRQRRIITRSERSVRYETVTAKISSPEYVQEISETRASELPVKANEILQSSSCVVTSTRDRQVTSYTVTGELNGDFINEEKTYSDDHIINSSLYFRNGQGTSQHTILKEKEGEISDCPSHKCQQSSKSREVLMHSATASETETQNVFASFVLEDKTCQSPKYTSNRLSDVNIVLKLQPEDQDNFNSQWDPNNTTGHEIEHEVNVTLNINSEDQNNVSTYVTNSSSCESAKFEDIKLRGISTGDKGSDYCKSESTSFEIADVNKFHYIQSGIKSQDQQAVTEDAFNETSSGGLSDNGNHTEGDVPIPDVICDIPLDETALQCKNESSLRHTDNQMQINDEETSTIPAILPIGSKPELSTLSNTNDIDVTECNHVSGNTNTHSTSVTDLGNSTILGGMSEAYPTETTDFVPTDAKNSDIIQSEPADSVQELKTSSTCKGTRVKNDMQSCAVKKERDRQGIRRFTATVCLQDVQESQAENRNKFRSRSKSPIGLKKEDGLESKQGVSCVGINRVSEIRRTFLGKASKINIPEPKIERSKPLSPSTQLTSKNSKWVNACGKWKRIPIDGDGNPLQGYLTPTTSLGVSSSTLSDIKEVPNENKVKAESTQNAEEQQSVPFSDKRAVFEIRKPKQPPKVLPKPSEAKRRAVVSCLKQWKGRVADRRSREFDDKIDLTKDDTKQPIEEQPKNQNENVNDTTTSELFCHLESKEVTKPEYEEKTNVQSSLDKSSEEMQKGNGSVNEETCTSISAPATIDSSEDAQNEPKEHKHTDQPYNQINELKPSEEKQKCKVQNNYSEIPLIDEEIDDDLAKEEKENKEVSEKEKPDVSETEESSFLRRDIVGQKRKGMNFSRAAGVWDSIIDSERLQSSVTTGKTNELEDSDETTPTNTPKTRKAFTDQEYRQPSEDGPQRPKYTPRLKAVKIKQEMFPLEGAHEDVKSVTDSLKESLKTLNSMKDMHENVEFHFHNSDDENDGNDEESPNIECHFENKILYSPSLFGNYKNYQFHKHSNVGLQRPSVPGESSDRHLSRQSEELLSEITEHEEVNGNDGGLNLNKQGQNSDTCLIPVKDKKAAASSPLVSQRNVFNRSQSLPTTSLSNTSQHRIIYRNGHFVIETNYEEEEGEETFVQLDEDLSLESSEDLEQSKVRFHNGRSYSEANLTGKYNSESSKLYDEDEDIDVFMKNENDVTVIENNNDGSSPNWHVLVKRRTRHEDQDGENRKSRPLSVDESQLQTHRVESDSEEKSHMTTERKRPSENVKRRSASFRELGTLGTVKLKRNSSFRKAQERGYLNSMKISQRNDSVGNLSLTPSEYSMCSDSGKSKGSGFFHKVFKKNKPMEKFTDPNKSKDSGTRKMSLLGLFTKKNRGEFMSQRSMDEVISPPIAVFQGDMDIHVDSAPNSPYSSQFRRRHTSAEIYDSSKANSLPRKSTDYQKTLKLANENNSGSRLLAVQNLDNHPKRPISPKPSNVPIPRRNSNVSLPSSPIRDQYDGPFKTSMSKLDSSDSASICSGGSSIIVDTSGYLPHPQESEITPSNSKDSGIQRDVSFHSSSESIKRSRGHKQQYTCTCSSVDSNQFRTLRIDRSCDCELAWMVKRSESLKETTTIRSTAKEGLPSSKTNLHGSKSLPTSPRSRSSCTTARVLSTAQQRRDLKVGHLEQDFLCGKSESGYKDPTRRLQNTICEETETVAEGSCECVAGFHGGQEGTGFHFTGEDTSLFEVNKEIVHIKTPQVPSESAPLELCGDNVEEKNQFNESCDESEAFFFTGIDTSLHEPRNYTETAQNNTNLRLGESSTDFEVKVFPKQEVANKVLVHEAPAQNMCDESIVRLKPLKARKSSIHGLEMDQKGDRSIPVSLPASLTGSMEESNPDPERPKSLFRELNRIGSMSLVQSKLMSWKALEEQYTNSNGKHLLPYGCSESPRRKNSRPSDNEDEQVERVTGNDTYQKGEIDAGVCNGTNGSEGSGGSEGSSGSEDSSGIQIEVSSETSCELDREGSEETVEEKGAVVESPCDEDKGNDQAYAGQESVCPDDETSSAEVVNIVNGTESTETVNIVDETDATETVNIETGSTKAVSIVDETDSTETVSCKDETSFGEADNIACESDSGGNVSISNETYSAEAVSFMDETDSVQISSNVDENKESDLNKCDDNLEGDNSDSETPQDPTANVVRRRKSPSPRPERPKSEISVRWADLEEPGEVAPVKRRESSRKSKQRPKSDLEDNVQMFDEMYEEVIDDYDFLTGGSSIGEEDMKPFGSQICLLPYSSLQNLEKYGHLYSYEQKPSMRRRNLVKQMSTPHPIKTRLERTPRKQRRKTPLVRSHSMPESLDKLSKRKKFLSTIASSNLHREDVLCHYDNDSSSDEGSEFSTDQISLHEKSLTSRISAHYLSTLRERPEPDTLTYAEALWDHITMDPEELGFRAGDVIDVADMSDKDWWWGAIDDREGWFPATFVRLRVNQEPSDLGLHAEGILEHSSPANHRISVLNSDQARENVVNEIINAEREYVKHLKDVVEGYIRHARKREDMFSEDRISVIFGNMEDIYEFSQKFLENIESSFVKEHPHQSQLGHCFLECSKEFEIYSDYCNNHPSASEELKDLYKNKKYRHFFEACRLLQEMIEIPLEGFLLTPVQKICKYPLQLNELLKYTPVTHPDHVHIQGALDAMKKIATLINERKRKMESIEKLAYWQTTVEDWQGPDLLEDSSELIYAGEMNKVNSAGWSQERNFFLFDHQLVYCKKDLLKKNGYSYKGRIDLDDCEIMDLEDGKDTQYNVTVKNAWKIHEVSREKWYLLVARSSAEKEKWMKAFTNERKRVKEDQENNFVPLYWKRMVLNKIKTSQEKQRSGGQMNYQKEFVRGIPSHATLPRSYSKKVQKKKGWFGFGNKKTK